MYVLWRKRRKDECERSRTFPGRVGPRILSLDSADYLYEQVNTSLVEKKKSLNEQNFDGESNCSGVVFKWAGLVMSIRFIVSSRVCSLAEMQFLSNRGRWFSCILYRRTQSIQKHIVRYDVKSKCLEKYFTVDEVGHEKLLATKSCFVQNQSPPHL